VKIIYMIIRARHQAKRLPWLAPGHRALLGTFISLIATTGITSALGIAYWGVAAHRTSMAAVGNGSAEVSAMTLAATFGMAGIGTTLIPALARRPREADGLLVAALCTAALISAVLAAGFWLAAATVSPRLAPYLHGYLDGGVFVIGAALTGACFVLDEALLGLLGGTPQLWRNVAFAVSKLVALAALSMVWHDAFGTPLLTAWVGGTAFSLVVAVALLYRRDVRLTVRPQWGALRGLARETMGNTWLNVALRAPIQFTPMLVTGLLPAADAGAFYVATTVTSVVAVLSLHFTTALYAADSSDPDGLAARLRFTLRISTLGGVVGVPLTILITHPLLAAFGSQYAAKAALPLQLMIAGYFGTALKNHYVALLRIQNRLIRGAVYGTVTCAVRLGAIAAGALAGGLTGMSVALLIVMSAEGLYGIPAIRAALDDSRPARRNSGPLALGPAARDASASASA
jgi:O-antigen/teichoic acid export membrane protein